MLNCMRGWTKGYRLQSPTLPSSISLNYFFLPSPIPHHLVSQLPPLVSHPLVSSSHHLISQLPLPCLPAPTPRLPAPVLAVWPLLYYLWLKHQLSYLPLVLCIRFETSTNQQWSRQKTQRKQWFSSLPSDRYNFEQVSLKMLPW